MHHCQGLSVALAALITIEMPSPARARPNERKALIKLMEFHFYDRPRSSIRCSMKMLRRLQGTVLARVRPSYAPSERLKSSSAWSGGHAKHRVWKDYAVAC